METPMKVLIGLGVVLISLIGLAIYFIPSLVARARGKRNRRAIYALNLLAGWTIGGWIGALRPRARFGRWGAHQRGVELSSVRSGRVVLLHCTRGPTVRGASQRSRYAAVLLRAVREGASRVRRASGERAQTRN